MARRFLSVRSLVFAGMCTLAHVAPAAAERRVALVVGNGNYANVARLENPGNDLESVAGVLRKAGFDVVVGKDLTRLQFEDTVRTFLRSAAGADVGLFYYSGHGIQVGDQNFLVPVDAQLKNAEDLELEAYSMQTVVRGLQARAKAQLVFLDACRDFPLNTAGYYVGARLETAGATRGLARVSAAIGSLLVYATAPDTLAQDGSPGELSPFSGAFARRALEPNREIRQVVSDIRRDVIEATGGRQVPWESSSLTQDLYFVQRLAKPMVEPMVRVGIGGGAGEVTLSPPMPRHPDGEAMTVQVDTPPMEGVLLSGGRVLAAGDRLTLQEFSDLRYRPKAGAGGDVDVVGYSVRDAAGNEVRGSLALVGGGIVPPPRPDSLSAAVARAPELAAAIAGRSVEVPIGVGPRPLNLAVAVPTPGLVSVLDAVPERGVLTLDGHAVTIGATLSPDELSRLTYQPQVGSEGGPQALAVKFQAGGREVVRADLRIVPRLDACDTLAAEPLDLDATAPGRLPNEIDGPAAVAACARAVEAFPEVPRFQYQLGRALLANRDLAGGQVAVRLANALGHVRAAYELGYLAQTGYGEAKDERRAAEHFKAAALKGDPFGLYSYGKALYYGRGIAPDPGTGLAMMGRAAELGHTYAMNELGAIYLEGKGVTADPARGVRYYTAGVQRGDIYSINNLALAYAAGQGVPRDPARAVELFKAAIQGGHPFAPNQLGRLYFNGAGVPKDAAEAAKWYKLGAERGDAFAADNLGVVLAQGLAGQKDVVGAAQAFALAGALGGAGGETARASLARLPQKARRDALFALARELGMRQVTGTDDTVLLDLAKRAWEASNPRRDLF